MDRVQILYCMMKDFLIFEEMRKYLVIYEKTVSPI
jgi:hypothetical protein